MKILVVDDEQDVQTLFLQKFRKEIREQKVEFAFAFNGNEALTYLAQLHHEAVLDFVGYQYAGHERAGTAAEH